MKDSGVSQDNPEYLKAYNILSAVQQQKVYQKQRQVYQQQQQVQQQAQQRQQQQNVATPQGATNGINSIVFSRDISQITLIMKCQAKHRTPPLRLPLHPQPFLQPYLPRLNLSPQQPLPNHGAQYQNNSAPHQIILPRNR